MLGLSSVRTSGSGKQTMQKYTVVVKFKTFAKVSREVLVEGVCEFLQIARPAPAVGIAPTMGEIRTFFEHGKNGWSGFAEVTFAGETSYGPHDPGHRRWYVDLASALQTKIGASLVPPDIRFL